MPSQRIPYWHILIMRTLFVHPALYRALNLMFPLDIGGLSPDSINKNKIGQGSMGQAVSIRLCPMQWSKPN